MARMTLRRLIIALGGLLTVFGIWTLARAHSQAGVCTIASPSAAKSGIDSLCVKTLMAYSEGFVFVTCGIIVAVIAFTMIARQEKIDLHSELRAMPRTTKKGEYAIQSGALDEDVQGAVSRILLQKST
jgi:hypothetical protein